MQAALPERSPCSPYTKFQCISCPVSLFAFCCISWPEVTPLQSTRCFLSLSHERLACCTNYETGAKLRNVTFSFLILYVQVCFALNACVSATGILIWTGNHAGSLPPGYKGWQSANNLRSNLGYCCITDSLRIFPITRIDYVQCSK